jgi:CubicO group peptidase (beta-lactamase class C family)
MKSLFLPLFSVVAFLACSPAPMQRADVDDYQTFENRVLPNSSQPQAWQLASNYNSQPLSNAELALHQRSQSLAYLVIQDGKIVYEQYFLGHSQTKISGLFSVTKSLVALMVGKALEEGKISSLEQPVGDFLPEFKQGEKAKIRLLDLLTMSSGLRWDETYSPGSTVAQAYLTDNLRSLMVGLPVARPTGQFAYASGDTGLLGLVLEVATGQNLSSYLEQKFWKPLGAENAALWSLDKAGGREKAFCCLTTTARDIAKFGQLVLQKGVWQGQQLLSGSYLQSATNNHFGQVKPNEFGYGYQFWVDNFGGQVFPSMLGILGQYVMVLPHKNAVVVRLGRSENANDFKDFYNMALTRLQ